MSLVELVRSRSLDMSKDLFVVLFIDTHSDFSRGWLEPLSGWVCGEGACFFHRHAIGFGNKTELTSVEGEEKGI